MLFYFFIRVFLAPDALAYLDRVRPRLDRVTDRSLVVVYLKVVPATKRLVAEEVDLFVSTILDVLQTVRLVPTHGKHVERYLTAYAELQPVVGVELLLQRTHEVLPDVIRQVELLVRVTLALAARASHRTDVQHALAELDERSALARKLEFAHVPQAEVDELLELLLPQVILEAVLVEGHAVFVRVKSVFGEDVVKVLQHVGTELLLLFSQVRSADDSDGNFFAQFREVCDHRGVSFLARDGERSVDVEQHECVFTRRCHIFFT
mmetsp:Transcript_543/g.1286  ORF Transcript_543/g.1286 Transcript_543/m.1286 type:complete len:264 (-) Transcript_543:90-881(-)